MIPRYSSEAKVRIAREGAVAITNFLEGVEKNARERAYSLLPSVSGFRAGTPLELQEKQRRLVAHITRPRTTPVRDAAKEWGVFAQLWSAWATQICGKGFLDIPGIRVTEAIDADSQLSSVFLEHLSASVNAHELAREDVERLYLFSPFPDNEKLVASLTAFMPRDQLASATRLRILPDRVDQLSAQIAKLRSDLAAATIEITNLKDTEELNRHTSAALTTIEDIDSRIAELNLVSDLVQQAQATIQAQIRTLIEQVRSSDESHRRAFGATSSHLDKVDSRLNSLGSTISSLTEAVQRTQADSENTTGIVQSIRAQIDALPLQVQVSRDANEEAPTLFASVPPAVPILTAQQLSSQLLRAAPARNNDQPRLLVIDAAVRARELPVLIGPLAREFAEAWISIAGGPAPLFITMDPTLFSVEDLKPTGSRGGRAPLARAFARAQATPSRPVTVILDDFDPAAAGYWLPELARAVRQPTKHGFPDNLLFLAVLEADPTQMALSGQRAAELFPLIFDDCAPHEAGRELFRPLEVSELGPDLIAGPHSTSSWQDRCSAFAQALHSTFSGPDQSSLVASFMSYVRRMKGMAKMTTQATPLEKRLFEAARLIVRNSGELI